jgi:hypothetical protein
MLAHRGFISLLFHRYNLISPAALAGLSAAYDLQRAAELIIKSGA